MATAGDQRDALKQSIQRAVRALPDLLAGRMDKATAAIHTSKPPRPKPPRPPKAEKASEPPAE